MRLEQEQEETTVFRRFLECGALDLEALSVKNRRPPEPDILCTTASGSHAAFELVEIIEPSWAQLIREQLAIEPQFQSALAERARVDASFAERYQGATVAIKFAGAGVLRQATAIPAVIELLNSLSPGFEGELQRDALNALAPRLAELRVARRSSSRGPVGQVLAVAAVGQPILQQFECKWRKTYETRHRVELLAYFGLQPIGAPSTWLPALQEWVEANWASGPFHRVWVCDLSVPAVLWSADRRAA